MEACNASVYFRILSFGEQMLQLNKTTVKTKG